MKLTEVFAKKTYGPDIDPGDFILWTPFKGTDDEEGQQRMQVINVGRNTIHVTDIFGKTFDLPVSKIEDVDKTPDDFFDQHLAAWKTSPPTFPEEQE